MLRTVMSSVMRRRRGLISAIWKLLSEGSDRQPHPLRQETCHATKPLTPRQRLRSIPQESPPKAAGIIAVMAKRDGPLAFGRPDPAQDRLQPDAVLVGRPDLDRLV